MIKRPRQEILPYSKRKLKEDKTFDRMTAKLRRESPWCAIEQSNDFSYGLVIAVAIFTGGLIVGLLERKDS